MSTPSATPLLDQLFASRMDHLHGRIIGGRFVPRNIVRDSNLFPVAAHVRPEGRRQHSVAEQHRIERQHRTAHPNFQRESEGSQLERSIIQGYSRKNGVSQGMEITGRRYDGELLGGSCREGAARRELAGGKECWEGGSCREEGKQLSAACKPVGSH